MPNYSVFDKTGKKVSDIALSDAIFAITPNASAMHLCVVAYLANQRQGTQSTLTRAEVRGGGKKPWRQKGSGRARAPSEARSGPTAVSHSAPSPVSTARQSTRRSEDSL